MKSKLFVSLMLASSLSIFADADVSTLADREALIKEAFSNDPEVAIKSINEAEQSGKTKVNDKSYIVVLKKEGEKYIRVAHFENDKLKDANKTVEDSLVSVVKGAEEKLANNSGPLPYEFTVGEKKYFAAITKHADYIIFNVSSKKEEVDKLLATDKPVDASTQTSPDPAKETSKSEENKSNAGVSASATATAPEAKPAENAEKKEEVKTETDSTSSQLKTPEPEVKDGKLVEPVTDKSSSVKTSGDKPAEKTATDAKSADGNAGTENADKSK